jgi:hypothetical protein
MEDEVARRQIAILNRQVLAMRDVVSRLLAYEALRHDDPEELFRELSEAVEEKIASLSTRKRAASIDLEEGIRKEIDWFVSAARLGAGDAE